MSVFGFDISYYAPSGDEDELALQRMSVAFERAGAEFESFGKHVFPLVQEALEKVSESQFEAEGEGPNRGEWAPLKPSYGYRKLREVGPKPVLVRTGRLRDALTKSSSGFANRAYTATEMQFGTQGVPYAGFHQTGTIHMVARPPFDFGSNAEDAINDAALKGARAAIRESRLDEFATLEE